MYILPFLNISFLMCVLSCFSRVRLFATLWTVALQAPLSRQEYCSGFLFPIPGHLPTEGSNLHLLHCRQILYCWATTEAPNFLWVAACVTIIQCNTWLEVFTLCYVLDRWMNIPYEKWQCPCHRNSVQSLSRVWLFATPWTEAHQASLCITNSGVYSNSCQLCWWHPTISSSIVPFSSLLHSFPASGSFQMSWFFASGGQSIGASGPASVLPKNTQDWSPLEWTGWISLQTKGLSRVFSNTTVQKHQFFSTQLSFSPTLTSKQDDWKNHSFD